MNYLKLTIFVFKQNYHSSKNRQEFDFLYYLCFVYLILYPIFRILRVLYSVYKNYFLQTYVFKDLKLSSTHSLSFVCFWMGIIGNSFRFVKGLLFVLA